MARTVDLPQAPLLVHEWGDEDGAPLVFVHHLGVTGSGRHLGEAAPLLADEGFRVVAPDLPGFAGSPPLAPEAYDLGALADLMAAVLDALAIERAAVVGLSWGASIAVHLGARHPDRVSAVVLLDAGTTDMQDDPEFADVGYEGQLAFSRETERQLRYAHQDAMLADARSRYPRWSPALEAAWVRAYHEQDGELRVRIAPETFASAVQALADNRPSSGLAGLGRAGVPTLLVLADQPAAGAERRAAGADRFRAAVPHGEVRQLDGVPHDVVAALGPDLAPLLAGFLRQP